MAKKAKKERMLKSMEIVKAKCIVKDCNKEYEANKSVFDNGDILISPPRCPVCQTAHLTNLRVNKTIKDLSLLGNLKTRLTEIQREAVVNAVGIAFQSLMDRYSGTTVKSSAFDLKKVKV